MVVSLTVVALAAAALVAGAGAGPLPPASHPYGATYGEWQARWFQWAFETPASINPGLDETGELCGVNQSGPVWFTSFAAHPGLTSRTCTVPAGKALFVLVEANECSNIEPPPFFGETEAELRECAATGFDSFGGTYSLTVDGVVVSDLASYRSQTPVFGYTLPEDNIYGLPAGTTASAALSDGVFVMLSPLSVGTHTIVIAVDSPVLGVLDERYEIHVVPRGQL
jgi:hypothetical protein